MTFPDHNAPCWNSATWRTETLLKVMADYGLTISLMCEWTSTKYPTVACWRKSVDRPTSVPHLKAVLFEISRGLV